MSVFVRDSGFSSKLVLDYYPGMVEITIVDNWDDKQVTFNVNMADWRAMNAAIETKHNGENNGR